MSRHRIGELEFNTELEKQEWIERSLVELIYDTNGGILDSNNKCNSLS